MPTNAETPLKQLQFKKQQKSCSSSVVEPGPYLYQSLGCLQEHSHVTVWVNMLQKLYHKMNGKDATWQEVTSIVAFPCVRGDHPHVFVDGRVNPPVAVWNLFFFDPRQAFELKNKQLNSYHP